MRTKSWALGATTCLLFFCSAAVFGQTEAPRQDLVSVSGATPQLQADDSGTCKPGALLTDSQLTFKQRGCYYARQVLSPKFALSASFSAAFGQFANVPHVPREHWDEFPHRFETYYARHSAQDAGELLAGYLHHEDTRPRVSMAHGFWRRTDAALMSVLTSTDLDGNVRLAYAPIAGSMSAAAVGSAMYRHDQPMRFVFFRAGLVYSHYLTSALYREFKPEMNYYIRRALHR